AYRCPHFDRVDRQPMTITATSDNQTLKYNIRNWKIGLQTFATGSLPRSGLVQRDVMECPEWASPYCDVRRFDDRCPTSNLAFYQCCEWLLASPLFARNVAAEVGEALAYLLVIECLVECIRERVENRLRCALGRKQRPPRQRLKFRQAGLH